MYIKERRNKIMKVWELEEGKEYVSDLDDGGSPYKIINGDLFYKNGTEYMRSYIYYTTVKDVDFTLYTPPTDWSKVEVDTKVLVRDATYASWTYSHFAKYQNGHVYVWEEGRTSFSVYTNDDCTYYNEAKLYTE